MDTTITVRLDEALAQKLDDLKENHSINISDFVRKAITERLEKIAPPTAEKTAE